MSSPLQVKRRKLNDATQKLSRPFVSPLRSASSKQATPGREANPGNLEYKPSTLAHTVKTTCPAPSKLPGLKKAAPPSSASVSGRRPPGFSRSNRCTDPSEVAAQKAITALEIQIKAVRNDIDTLKQAERILSSSSDAELEALADKWRLASQQAAEELFGVVKERVCRMGGVAAWRESERRKYERVNGLGEFASELDEDDDADCEFDSQGEELPQEEQEYRKAEKRRARQEAMEAMDEPQLAEDGHNGNKLKAWQKNEPGQDGGGGSSGDNDDDDTFTMDMMLRSLNIDLEVIGYDKIRQRWMS
ncbi:hypothetical protein M433DRAFT_165607 [Acidomyces richmondensis BFW]|nr:MAG: hypothetical protein FE78DRAFT_107114 [Acidomyces sp. 'richmondensis']KYG46015.1 hypothetical protein M433DRAFT_165607 [Acidomyces richmondensis BFW]